MIAPVTATGGGLVIYTSPAEITAAFEAWETGYRGDPESLMTAEETAAFSVAAFSEQRSIYFVALLRTIQKGVSA